MKLTILTTSFPRFEGDAAGSFIYKYTRLLARNGCDLRVIAPHHPEVNESLPWTRLNVHYFKYFFPVGWQALAYDGGFPARIRKNWFSVLQFPFFITSFVFNAYRAGRKSDILHAHWTLAGVVAIMVKFLTRTPVVITLWGSDIFLTKIPVLSTLLRKILNRANAIVCESRQFEEELAHLGFSKNKISVISNGVDFTPNQPKDKMALRQQLSLPTDQYLILSIGRLVPVKGHIHLLNAMPKIVQHEKKATLIIVGEGELRQTLEDRVNELGLSSHVIFTGFQNADTIPDWLNAGDIFVLPSLSEGKPNIVQEAMACGLPVISTQVGSVPEMIKSGNNGILVPPESPDSLARYVVGLLKNEKIRLGLGENARKTIFQNRWTWENQADALKSLYKKFLRGQPDGPARILTVYYRHKPGGFCKRLRLKIQAYLEKGWVVHYIAVRPYHYQHENLIPHILPTPMKKHESMLFWSYFFLFSPWYVLYIAAREKVDLISVFSPVYACICAPARLFLKIPLLQFIRTVPNTLELTYKQSRFIRWIEHVLEKFGLKCSDVLLANSQAIRDEMIRRHGPTGERIEILSNNIVQTPFNREEQKKDLLEEFSLPPDSFIIATSGLLTKRKNLKMLITAFAAVEKRNAILLIIGYGDELTPLRDYARAQGVLERIAFTGWRRDALSLYQGIDLFILPSFLEGMSNSLLEAMACEIPCLVSAIPENMEVLRDPELHFSPDDSHALAEKISRAMDDKDYYANLLEKTMRDKNRFEFDWGDKIIQIAGGMMGRQTRTSKNFTSVDSQRI